MLKLIFSFFLSLSLLTTSNFSYSTLYQEATKQYERVYNSGYHTNILIIVDFSLPSYEKRLWVIDMNNGQVLLNTYVTHGQGSGQGSYATSFSNQDGTHKSSLGTYITLGTYYGKHGLSVRLKGLDYSNNNAERRAIVIHSANYIGDGKTGTSWGCFAVPSKDMMNIIRLTKNGAVLYAGV